MSDEDTWMAEQGVIVDRNTRSCAKTKAFCSLLASQDWAGVQ